MKIRPLFRAAALLIAVPVVGITATSATPAQAAHRTRSHAGAFYKRQPNFIGPASFDYVRLQARLAQQSFNSAPAYSQNQTGQVRREIAEDFQRYVAGKSGHRLKEDGVIGRQTVMAAQAAFREFDTALPVSGIWDSRTQKDFDAWLSGGRAPSATPVQTAASGAITAIVPPSSASTVVTAQPVTVALPTRARMMGFFNSVSLKGESPNEVVCALQQKLHREPKFETVDENNRHTTIFYNPDSGCDLTAAGLYAADTRFQQLLAARSRYPVKINGILDEQSLGAIEDILYTANFYNFPENDKITPFVRDGFREWVGLPVPKDIITATWIILVRDFGYSKTFAAAPMGNIDHESGFIEDRDSHHGDEYLCQWRDPRAEMLAKFAGVLKAYQARHRGTLPHIDYQIQLRFLALEISKMPQLQRFTSSPMSAGKLAVIFMKRFERPRHLEGIHGKRATAAMRYYGLYKDMRILPAVRPVVTYNIPVVKIATAKPASITGSVANAEIGRALLDFAADVASKAENGIETLLVKADVASKSVQKELKVRAAANDIAAYQQLSGLGAAGVVFGFCQAAFGIFARKRRKKAVSRQIKPVCVGFDGAREKIKYFTPKPIKRAPIGAPDRWHKRMPLGENL